MFSLQLTEEDWAYKTQPSEFSCQGTKEGRCTWPRGKVLGGSSTLNAMLYVRGNRRDYDTWAELGNPGWDYDSALKDFAKFEKLLVPELSGYGTSGELGLTRYSSEQPLRELIRETATKLGLKRLDAEGVSGYFDSLMTVEGGTRSNTAKVFLGAAKERKNLKLAVNAHVTRIIIDENTKTAKGVAVQIDDQLLTLSARKEVIVSAGAINSPQLLMLSGIGPRNHLESLNIKTIQDLPVGEHLEDHVTMFGSFIKIDESAVVAFQPHEVLTELYKYFAFQQGAFAGISLTNLIGFVSTKNETDYPNLQIIHTMHTQNEDYLLPVLLNTLNAKDEFLTSLLEFNKQHNLLAIYPVLLNPKSVGRVLLNTTDPFEHPLIHANYFTDENGEDIATLLEGIRFIQRLLATEPLSQYHPEILKLDIPNCNKLPFDSDEYWECVVRDTAKTLYHPTGTCKMGPSSDPSAVVDPTLKVRGVQSLRVADASIMPKIVSANTNAASILIGQKAADFIIKQYQNDRHEEL